MSGYVVLGIIYGAAQRQLDTRTRVNGKRLAGKLNEHMPNPCGCPSPVKSVTVRLLVWRLPRNKALGYIVITHRYAARDAQYRLFMLEAWIRFHS